MYLRRYMQSNEAHNRKIYLHGYLLLRTIYFHTYMWLYGTIYAIKRSHTRKLYLHGLLLCFVLEMYCWYKLGYLLVFGRFWPTICQVYRWTKTFFGKIWNRSSFINVYIWGLPYICRENRFSIIGIGIYLLIGKKHMIKSIIKEFSVFWKIKG